MWEPQGIFINYLLSQPTILFGNNSIWEIADYPAAKIAVIHGQSVRDDIKKLMLEVFKKKELRFFLRSWEGEPQIDELRGTLHELENMHPDVIIAIGGGSVIDGAKLCRLYYEFPYYLQGMNNISELLFKTRFIAIPTTVGSGAEASSAAVYWNAEAGRKEMIVCHSLRPSVVVFDPTNVENLPYQTMVFSAMDAIAHITEGYISNRNNELADRISEFALSLIFREIKKADRDVVDFISLQYGGYLGGIVQNHCMVGLAHAIAHQLEGYGYSHGEAVALLLPASIRMLGICSDVVESRYKQLFDRADVGSKDDFLNFLKMLVRQNSSKERDLKNLLESLLSDGQFLENVIKDRGGQGSPIPLSEELINKFVREYL